MKAISIKNWKEFREFCQNCDRDYDKGMEKAKRIFQELKAEHKKSPDFHHEIFFDREKTEAVCLFVVCEKTEFATCFEYTGTAN